MSGAERLFVYGTLVPGGPNEHILKEIGGTFTPATVRGRLVEAGWGATMGYPGIVFDDETQRVEGVVLESGNLAAHWDKLDAFEGPGYERVSRLATLADGTEVTAYVYALRTA